MKEYWYVIHPELAFFFTERNLRKQATRIEKNKPSWQNNNNRTEINNVITNNDTTEDTAIETTVNNAMNNVERNNDSIDILRSSDRYKFLRECFITNYNTFKEMMKEQQQPTSVKTMTKLCMQLLISLQKSTSSH